MSIHAKQMSGWASASWLKLFAIVSARPAPFGAQAGDEQRAGAGQALGNLIGVRVEIQRGHGFLQSFL